MPDTGCRYRDTRYKIHDAGCNIYASGILNPVSVSGILHHVSMKVATGFVF
jgi:hypothetical protein